MPVACRSPAWIRGGDKWGTRGGSDNQSNMCDRGYGSDTLYLANRIHSCYLCCMATIYIRRVGDGLAADLKAAAAQARVTLREYVLDALARTLDWNEVKGGDHGLGKTKGVIRAQDMSGVRGGIQDDTGNEGRGRGAGPGTVQRPQHDTPTDRGAVGGSIRPDTGAKEKRWLGPVHAKGCKCPACQ